MMVLVPLDVSSGCEASHGSDQPAFWAVQRGNRASGGEGLSKLGGRMK